MNFSSRTKPTPSGWREISVRTLDHMLEKQQPLDDDELSLWTCWTPTAVSRFAGPYFQAVADGPRDDYLGSFGSPSAARLVVSLAGRSRHARRRFPDLAQAIDAAASTNRTIADRSDWPWVAAFAIAQRDPWQGEDAWLAQRIQRTRAIGTGQRGRSRRRRRRGVA